VARHARLLCPVGDSPPSLGALGRCRPRCTSVRWQSRHNVGNASSVHFSMAHSCDKLKNSKGKVIFAAVRRHLVAKFKTHLFSAMEMIRLSAPRVRSRYQIPPTRARSTRARCSAWFPVRIARLLILRRRSIGAVMSWCQPESRLQRLPGALLTTIRKCLYLRS